MEAVVFSPYSQEFAANPYPVYQRLREENPIFYSREYGLTFFARHRDINQLLADKRLGRSMDHIYGDRISGDRISSEREPEEKLHNALPCYNRYVRTNLLEKEGDDHARMLEELAAQRRSDPQDDLISALALAEEAGDALSHDELIATCMLMLNGGHESTVNSAGNGLLALLRHPEQMQKLKDNPGLIKTAVEEILRYDSPLHFFHRFVLEDMAYEGFEFKKGDMIGYLYGSANRDAEAFENADHFDITREPNPHIAFGRGTHFCLGAPLARLELAILFKTLFNALPGIRLLDEQPEYYTGLVFRGLKQLPIAW